MNYAEYISKDCPVLFVGAPGIGKTEIIRQSFDYVKIFLASAMVEEDVAGIPYRKGAEEHRTTPEGLRKLIEADAEGKTTCLFFDEIDKARKTVADTLLTLISSRAIGSTILPENTCIVAAANPQEFGGGDGISEAMISRFSVINTQPDANNWAKWARNNLSNKSEHLITAIKRGIIPIIDRVGEGLETRLCNPRTLYKSLLILESNKSEEVKENLVKGLLPAGIASQLLMMHFGQRSELEKKSTEVVLASLKKKSFSPLRKVL